MASKVYTAQELRAAADLREAWGDKDEVNNMLRQAADMIERKKREKKREKKYEYSVHPADVYGVFQHRSAAELNVNFFKALGVRAHLIRREVGDWEKIKIPPCK